MMRRQTSVVSLLLFHALNRRYLREGGDPGYYSLREEREERKKGKDIFCGKHYISLLCRDALDPTFQWDDASVGGCLGERIRENVTKIILVGV